MATPATVGETAGAVAHGAWRCARARRPRHRLRRHRHQPALHAARGLGHAGGLHLSGPAVLGVLSLVFWSLVLVVTVKYVALILRADNRGEGGVLALGTLAARAVPGTSVLCRLIPALTIAGLACSTATR